MASPASFNIGEFEVTRILELEEPFRKIGDMFPAATEDHLATLVPQLYPWCIDAETRAILPVQSYLVRTPKHLILLDTCIGCDKTNTSIPQWHQRSDTAWLERLLAAGVALEEITHVLCTHLHPDHAGWNTRLIDGRWVPTFPNATYIFGRKELAHAKNAERDIWLENVLPVIAAGQAKIVEEDHQIEDGIWLEPTPGHTPGHVAIHLESAGEHAVMWGDLLHSPAQCVHPEWSYRRDTSPEDSTASRRRVLEAAAEHNHLILPSHFPSPSVGRITAKGDAWWFDYDPELKGV
jgi:glyoxylase-like metal-dependent hydrolase (beta-lactamase superfamily II)